MLVGSVEDILDCIELYGLEKKNRDDRTVYMPPAHLGKGTIRISGQIGRQYLIQCDVCFKKPFTYLFDISERFIEISSVETSDLVYELTDSHDVKVTKGIHIHINAIDNRGVLFIPADTRLTYTSYVIRETVYTDYFPDPEPETDLLAPGNAFIASKISTFPQLTRILSDLNHCGMGGRIKKLYYQNKALEALCLISNHIGRHRGQYPCIPVLPGDRAAVRTVKQILKDRMQTPPTIPVMAKEAGVNTSKLKQIFKQETGRTIFGYLRSIRLETAISQMEDPYATISSISLNVGYNSPGKFAAAFKKQYGVNPGQYLRFVRENQSAAAES